MQYVDLKKCLVSKLVDKTIYLTKLVVGADAFRTYGDDYMLLKAKEIIPKKSDSVFVRTRKGDNYSLCAEFSENGQEYFVFF